MTKNKRAKLVKKYCESCKYYEWGMRQWSLNGRSTCFKVIGFKDTPIRQENVTAQIEVQNKNNNCKYYEKQYYDKKYCPKCKEYLGTFKREYEPECCLCEDSELIKLGKSRHWYDFLLKRKKAILDLKK
jgi:hypothetical protein